MTAYGRAVILLLFLVLLAIPVVWFFLGFRFFWIEDVLNLAPVYW